MKTLSVGQHVLLKCDLPEVGLHRGEHGTVRSAWFRPVTWYEVAFREEPSEVPVLALVTAAEVDEDPAPAAGPVDQRGN